DTPATDTYTLSYTTLFRSLRIHTDDAHATSGADDVDRRIESLRCADALDEHIGTASLGGILDEGRRMHGPGVDRDGAEGLRHLRSEEHTSELQSRENLVCR